MKTKKLKIKELQVESFVTTVKEDNTITIRGGNPTLSSFLCQSSEPNASCVNTNPPPILTNTSDID